MNTVHIKKHPLWKESKKLLFEKLIEEIDEIEIDDNLDISITSSQWEEELIEEYRLKQEAKKYQLALTRLAGKKTVRELNVAQLDLTVKDINPKDLNYEPKKVEVELLQDNKETKENKKVNENSENKEDNK